MAGELMTPAQRENLLVATNTELARQLDELNDQNEVLRAIVRTLEDIEVVVPGDVRRCEHCGGKPTYAVDRVGDRFRDAIRTAVGRSASAASARGLPDDAGVRVDREGQQHAPENAVGGAAAVDQPRAGLCVLPRDKPTLTTPVERHEAQLTQMTVVVRDLWNQVFPFTPWPL